jgi:hypothetical protein
MAMAAAAAGAASISIAAPVTPEPEKTFRAGEFLQSSRPAPGAQFVTESEIQKSMDQAVGSEVDALTELEPMAASVETAPPQPAEPRKALDGWASLQARLTRSIVPASPGASSSEPPPQNELLGHQRHPRNTSRRPNVQKVKRNPKPLFSPTCPEKIPSLHPRPGRNEVELSW